MDYNKLINDADAKYLQMEKDEPSSTYIAWNSIGGIAVDHLDNSADILASKLGITKEEAAALIFSAFIERNS